MAINKKKKRLSTHRYSDGGGILVASMISLWMPLVEDSISNWIDIFDNSNYRSNFLFRDETTLSRHAVNNNKLNKLSTEFKKAGLVLSQVNNMQGDGSPQENASTGMENYLKVSSALLTNNANGNVDFRDFALDTGNYYGNLNDSQLSALKKNNINATPISSSNGSLIYSFNFANANGGPLIHGFEGGGGMNMASAITTGLGDSIDNWVLSSSIDDAAVNAAKVPLQAKVNGRVTSNSFDSLMKDWGESSRAKTDWNRYDFQGESSWKRNLKGQVKAVGDGMKAATTSGNWWVGGITSAVSGLANIFGTMLARKTARRAARKLNRLGTALNEIQLKRFIARANTLNNVLNRAIARSFVADGGLLNFGQDMNLFGVGGAIDYANQLEYLKNYRLALLNKANILSGINNVGYIQEPNLNNTIGTYAFGGNLGTNGTNFTDGLTYFNNGGRHEENPNQGVPLGIAPDGLPNLVEEGEVKWNEQEYIFSDRLHASGEFLEKWKLPKTYADKTYAYIVKNAPIVKEAEERPNDPSSQDALDKFLAATAEDQERQKAEKEATEIQEQLSNMSDDELAALGALLQLELESLEIIDQPTDYNELEQGSLLEYADLQAIQQLVALLEGMLQPRMSAEGGPLAEGGEITAELLQGMELQPLLMNPFTGAVPLEQPAILEEAPLEVSQEEPMQELVSEPEPPLKRPSAEDMSTKELNAALEEIIQYAKDNKDRLLLREAKKIKKSGSREDKEEFVDETFEEMEEERAELDLQAQQAQLAELMQSALEPKQMQLLQPSEEEMAVALQQALLFAEGGELQTEQPLENKDVYTSLLDALKQLASSIDTDGNITELDVPKIRLAAEEQHVASEILNKYDDAAIVQLLNDEDAQNQFKNGGHLFGGTTEWTLKININQTPEEFARLEAERKARDLAEGVTQLEEIKEETPQQQVTAPVEQIVTLPETKVVTEKPTKLDILLLGIIQNSNNVIAALLLQSMLQSAEQKVFDRTQALNKAKKDSKTGAYNKEEILLDLAFAEMRNRLLGLPVFGYNLYTPNIHSEGGSMSLNNPEEHIYAGTSDYKELLTMLGITTFNSDGSATLSPKLWLQHYYPNVLLNLELSDEDITKLAISLRARDLLNQGGDISFVPQELLNLKSALINNDELKESLEYSNIIDSLQSLKDYVSNNPNISDTTLKALLAEHRIQGRNGDLETALLDIGLGDKNINDITEDDVLQATKRYHDLRSAWEKKYKDLTDAEHFTYDQRNEDKYKTLIENFDKENEKSEKVDVQNEKTEAELRAERRAVKRAEREARRALRLAARTQSAADKKAAEKAAKQVEVAKEKENAAEEKVLETLNAQRNAEEAVRKYYKQQGINLNNLNDYSKELLNADIKKAVEDGITNSDDLQNKEGYHITRISREDGDTKEAYTSKFNNEALNYHYDPEGKNTVTIQDGKASIEGAYEPFDQKYKTSDFTYGYSDTLKNNVYSWKDADGVKNSYPIEAMGLNKYNNPQELAKIGLYDFNIKDNEDYTTVHDAFANLEELTNFYLNAFKNYVKGTNLTSLLLDNMLHRRLGGWGFKNFVNSLEQDTSDDAAKSKALALLLRNSVKDFDNIDASASTIEESDAYKEASNQNYTYNTSPKTRVNNAQENSQIDGAWGELHYPWLDMIKKNPTFSGKRVGYLDKDGNYVPVIAPDYDFNTGKLHGQSKIGDITTDDYLLDQTYNRNILDLGNGKYVALGPDEDLSLYEKLDKPLYEDAAVDGVSGSSNWYRLKPQGPLKPLENGEEGEGKGIRPIVKGWYNDLMRMAPLFNQPFLDSYASVSALLNGVGNLHWTAAPRHGEYLKYEPVDTLYRVNQLQSDNNAARRGIMNLANGNTGMAMANLALLNSKAQSLLGETLLGIDTENWNRKKDVINLHNDVDKFYDQLAVDADKANMSNNSLLLANNLKAAELMHLIESSNNASKSAALADKLGILHKMGTENQLNLYYNDFMKSGALRLPGITYSPQIKKDANGKEYVEINGLKYYQSANGGEVTIRRKQRIKRYS